MRFREAGEELTKQDFMVKLPGSSRTFQCTCGCNVFRKLKEDLTKYVCNSCELIWQGE